MKKSKSNDLIAYALSFVSFVLPKIDVDEIILFGSVARGEASKKSDIDLFFNVKSSKDLKIDRELIKFYKSKIAEVWNLKGIDNSIKVIVGDLDKWKLKRSVISDGIVLYGKYKKVPEKLNAFVYFNIAPIENVTKRNRVIRKLFGRKEENYFTKGLIEELNGKKLNPSSFIIALSDFRNVKKFLDCEKVNYKFFEFWSDQI